MNKNEDTPDQEDVKNESQAENPENHYKANGFYGIPNIDIYRGSIDQLRFQSEQLSKVINQSRSFNTDLLKINQNHIKEVFKEIEVSKILLRKQIRPYTQIFENISI